MVKIKVYIDEQKIYEYDSDNQVFIVSDNDLLNPSKDTLENCINYLDEFIKINPYTHSTLPHPRETF